MLIIEKLASESGFSVKDGNKSTVFYKEPFSPTVIGDEVTIRSQIRDIEHRALYGDVVIDGATFGSAADVHLALSFLTSFKRGGGSSPSPTPVYQSKSLTIKENGSTSVLPDKGFDALSKVDVSVNLPVPIDPTKPIHLYDYEGTLLYTYSLEEAKALTSLPDQPVHAGLTAAGWTHTLEEVKAEAYGLYVGATYRTTDGKTRAFITLNARTGRTVNVDLTVDGTATLRIDWGDGSNQNVTATSRTSHTYASVGDYQITVWKMSGSGTYSLGRYDDVKDYNTVCISAPQTDDWGVYDNPDPLTKLYVGETDKPAERYAVAGQNITEVLISHGVREIEESGLDWLPICKGVVFPKSVTALGGGNVGSTDTGIVNVDNLLVLGEGSLLRSKLFSYIIPAQMDEIPRDFLAGSQSLEKIILSDNISVIRDNAFAGTPKLRSTTIPNSVVDIAPYAFQESGIREIIFESPVPVPGRDEYGTPIWEELNLMCKIYVPNASVSAYKAAWPEEVDRIYPISERA